VSTRPASTSLKMESETVRYTPSENVTKTSKGKKLVTVKDGRVQGKTKVC